MTGGASGSHDGASWAGSSIEFQLTCAADGRVLWADVRARARLDLAGPATLPGLVAPGMEQKAMQLLERAGAGPLREVELPFRVGDGIATASLSARAGRDGVVELMGCWIPEERGRDIEALQESMQQVLDLNREVVRQKREIERQKGELEARQQELTRTLGELRDSNRGIATLNLELDDKTDVLRRAADVKSRVIANVSHEFRTPLHTILGLTRLLMEGADGPLTDEQRTQMRFIRQSAEELAAMVDDVLDLASAEAGRLVVRPERFVATELMSSLRGMLRPLPHAEGVDLRFVDAPAGLEVENDQGKIAQVLRNLVSNALKFTERGHVEVSLREEGEQVVFEVEDTGIGIAPENVDLVFQEFGQIDNELQAKSKGTGLGLPLSRRLAELLGGELTLRSEPGKGSVFTLRIPRVHPEARKLSEIESRPLDPSRAPILVVEDDRKTIFIYEKYLAMAGYQVVPARTVADAERLLRTLRPAAIVLDIMLDGESSWTFLARLKREAATRDVPVLVVTVTNREQKARALGADEFWLKPVDQEQLLRRLRALRKVGEARVLVIDDDARARYLVSRYLEGGPYSLTEASTGAEGVEAARSLRPDVILLDFLLKGTTAFDVLDELKSDPLTRNIPVIVITSHTLDEQELQRLAQQTEVILSKESLSRELAINRIRDALAKAGRPPIVARERA